MADRAAAQGCTLHTAVSGIGMLLLVSRFCRPLAMSTDFTTRDRVQATRNVPVPRCHGLLRVVSYESYRSYHLGVSKTRFVVHLTRS